MFLLSSLEGNQLAVFATASSPTQRCRPWPKRPISLNHIHSAARCRHRARTRLRVRFFTTTEELPFAGHPTLGTAVSPETAARKNCADLQRRTHSLRFSTRDGLPFGTNAHLADTDLSRSICAKKVARASGLADQRHADDLPIQTWHRNPFAIVSLKSLAVLQKLSRHGPT